ncbi:hypothetical protein BST81_13545 [Leptolyngbya sp. 'hensonii']|nr:hypothetical protein BST81_13545 [Leptolyngbya sp. 'hensonii']
MGVLVVTVSLGSSLPVQARSAMLFAPDPSSRINVRSGPSIEDEVISTGLMGDRVETLREIEGKDGYVWYYVRFNSSGLEGWVREDRLTFSLTAPPRQGTVSSIALAACQQEAERVFGPSVVLDVVEVRLDRSAIRTVILRSRSRGLSGLCRVFSDGTIVAFEQQRENRLPANQTQTLATFQTARYSVRIWQTAGLHYMNLYDKKVGRMVVNNARVSTVVIGEITTYQTTAGNRTYTIRVKQSGQPTLEVGQTGQPIVQEVAP